MRKYLPTEAVVELITSLILSRLVCCSSLLSGLPASDRLPVVLNMLASLRTNLNTDHSTSLHQSPLAPSPAKNSVQSMTMIIILCISDLFIYWSDWLISCLLDWLTGWLTVVPTVSRGVHIVCYRYRAELQGAGQRNDGITTISCDAAWPLHTELKLTVTFLLHPDLVMYQCNFAENTPTVYRI